MAQASRTFASIANGRVQVPPGVIVRQVADESVILNLETEHYFGLDPVGRRVLEALTDSRDVRSAVATLIREFEVDEPTLQRDVIDLVTDLEEHGLVTLSGTEPGEESGQG